MATIAHVWPCANMRRARRFPMQIMVLERRLLRADRCYDAAFSDRRGDVPKETAGATCLPRACAVPHSAAAQMKGYIAYSK